LCPTMRVAIHAVPACELALLSGSNFWLNPF
jgi:hypothetical protein